MTTRIIPSRSWTERLVKKRVRKKPRSCPTEHQEAVALNHWRLAHIRQYPELVNLILIPNGEERAGRLNTKGQRYSPAAQRLKEEGLEPGTSDYFLAVPRGHYGGFWLELKALDGRATPKQLEFLYRMKASGYDGGVARGWVVASEALINYLATWG